MRPKLRLASRQEPKTLRVAIGLAFKHFLIELSALLFHVLQKRRDVLRTSAWTFARDLRRQPASKGLGEFFMDLVELRLHLAQRDQSKHWLGVLVGP